MSITLFVWKISGDIVHHESMMVTAEIESHHKTVQLINTIKQLSNKMKFQVLKTLYKRKSSEKWLISVTTMNDVVWPGNLLNMPSDIS